MKRDSSDSSHFYMAFSLCGCCLFHTYLLDIRFLFMVRNLGFHNTEPRSGAIFIRRWRIRDKSEFTLC